MEKIVYLLDSELDAFPLEEALVGSVGDRILAEDPLELVVHVKNPPGPEVDDLENNMDPEGLMSACVSVWLPTVDRRAPVERALAEVATRIAGYLVTESVPREYASRSWPDGDSSPGVTVATALCEKRGLDLEMFYARWHGSHTPLSLRIHPLTCYVRNAVARTLTEGAPPYRALVFEAVASLDVLADLDVWYGSPEGRDEAVRDLLSFADYRSMASVTARETILRSAPWRAGTPSRP